MKAGQEIRENRSPLRDGGHWADGQTDSWDAGCAEERKLKGGTGETDFFLQVPSEDPIDRSNARFTCVQCPAKIKAGTF